jgi:SAM-dependent methyltransferase
MDRTSWLEDKARLAEERMDTLFAPDYDEHWGRIEPTHARMVRKLLSLGGYRCKILDAACGTGKYWPMILDGERSLVGIDNSRQMLRKAQAKFPGVPVEKLRLQEISFEDEFDAIICVDAMELVPPEDWPSVLRNFHRALKAGGYLYITVETADREQVEAAFTAGTGLGLPLVMGEWAHEGGYHYYPELDHVRRWAGDTPFDIFEEAASDGYHHFLARQQT